MIVNTLKHQYALEKYLKKRYVRDGNHMAAPPLPIRYPQLNPTLATRCELCRGFNSHCSPSTVNVFS
jgi:hypothetical protein